MNTPNEQQSREIKENKCSDTWTCFQELEDSLWQQNSLGEYRQRGMRGGLRLAVRRRVVPPLSLWRSTPTHNSSSDTTSQMSPSIPTSETTIPNQESLTSFPVDFPARVHQTQEAERDSNIQLPLFGERDLDALLKLNPASVLLNNLKEFSDEDLELFLPPYIWQDTVSRLKQSRRESLGRVIKDSDYLSFPTLTSNVSTTSRPAGQTKCEKWFRDKGLIPSGSQLGSEAIAMIMGFPPNWFDCLSPTEPQEESKADISQEELVLRSKQRSPSAESSTSQKLLGGEDNSPLSTESGSSPSQNISIPCLVKQPKQPEIKGLIRKDEGDRFLVEVDDETISVSKLFVYPDFSKSVGQIEKNPRKNITPSKENPRKTRRKKGQGNGTIYYRMVRKNGRQYQEAYYHYIENGKKRTKYIPKKLLDRVKEAESRKKPVADILVLLVGKDKNPRKSSDTLRDGDRSSDSGSEKVMNTSVKNPRKTIPTSKKRRDKGKGSGWIQCKPIKRSGKEYQQYWYHYEEWSGGGRLLKKSSYIPKKLWSKIEQMDNDQVPVVDILRVLRKKKKQ